MFVLSGPGDRGCRLHSGWHNGNSDGYVLHRIAWSHSFVALDDCGTMASAAGLSQLLQSV